MRIDCCWPVFFCFRFCFCFPLQVPGGLLTFPSAASVAAEPLGVVLVISAWNYPFCTFVINQHYYPCHLSCIMLFI